MAEKVVNHPVSDYVWLLDGKEVELRKSMRMWEFVDFHTRKRVSGLFRSRQKAVNWIKEV